MTEKFVVLKETEIEGMIKDEKCCCSECEVAFKTVNGLKITKLTRSVPATEDYTVELGNFTKGSGAHNLLIGLNVSGANFAVAKTFLIAAGYNETGPSWREVVGLNSSGDFADNDIFLDAKVQGNYCYLRLRRGGGAQVAPAEIHIINLGREDAAWTETSETGSDTPPSYYMGTLLKSMDGKVYAYGDIDMQNTRKLLNLSTEGLLQFLVEDMRGLTEVGTCTFGVTRFTSGGVFYGLGRYVKGGANNSQGTLMMQMQLPSDFESFLADGIVLETRRNDTLDTMTLTMNNGTTKTKDSTIDASDINPEAQDTWETFSFTPGGSYSAGDIVTFNLTVDVDTDERGFVRRLVMKYTKKVVV